MAEYAAEPIGDRRTLSVSGEVDIATAEQFVAEAISCLDAADVCEIDLAAVTFIDSSGLGALVRIRNAARERGKEVRLTQVPASVDRLLAVTGLSGMFDTGSKA